MSYTLIRNFVAIVLLIGAGLKFHQLATEPVVGVGMLDSRWFLIASVEIELFFGLWLLSNNGPWPTWGLALACFCLFACVSLTKAISGNASCGCFGRVPVNPWLTAALDLAIVASLLRWRPNVAATTFPVHFREFHLRPIAVLVIWIVVGAPAAFTMGTYTSTTISDVNGIIHDGQIVVLEPDKWIGKQFPLLDYIEIDQKLNEGEWLVVLYHHDCSKCLEVLPMYERLAQRSRYDIPAVEIALIEVPPFGSHELSADTFCRHARLSNSNQWFVAAPVELRLRDGLVVESRSAELETPR